MPLDWIANAARITAERVGTEAAESRTKLGEALNAFDILREAGIANVRWWRPRGLPGDLPAFQEARKVMEAAGAASQALTKAECFGLAVWAALDEDAEKEARSPAAVKARLKASTRQQTND